MQAKWRKMFSSAHRKQSLSRNVKARKYKFANKYGKEEHKEEDWTEFGRKTKKCWKKKWSRTNTMMRMETMWLAFEAFDSLDLRSHTRSTPCTVFMHIPYSDYPVRVGAVPSLYMLCFVVNVFPAFGHDGGEDDDDGSGFPAVAFNKTDFAVSPQE